MDFSEAEKPLFMAKKLFIAIFQNLPKVQIQDFVSEGLDLAVKSSCSSF